MRSINPRTALIPMITAVSILLLAVSRYVYGASPPETAAVDSSDLPPNPSRISNAFPHRVQQWEMEVHSAAQETGLDPNLISAVILQESGGQPHVTSSSGAVGLMQVMPRDGIAASFLCVNGPCFKNRPSTEELLDPAFNVHYASRFLAGLIAREGSLRGALHAYGPMDVGFSYADAVLAIYQSYH